MSVLESRGGWPQPYRNASVLHTAVTHHRFGFISKYLEVRTTSNPVKVYFTLADATADTNYILVPVPAASTPNGEWKGPAEVREVWLKGSGGAASVELVAYQRRG